jgi:hypothetical protein
VETITGLWTFSRGANAPFAVAASALVVTNLDADKLDGQHAAAFALTGHDHDADYAALVHTHVKADITDFAHTHVKADITDFAHTHVKADITDTPWAKADLPSAVAYEDEANTFSSAQTINAALTVTGITTFNTVPYTWPGADAAGQLTSDGAGNLSWAAGGGGVGGSGTADTIAKFTAASTIGDSTITDDGSTVTVANPLIASVTAATIGAAVRATDSGNAYLYFQNSTTGSGTTDGMVIGINSGEQGFIFHYETGEPIRIGTQGSERVRVHAAGGFAIGTTQSGELVEIGSSSTEDVYIRISNSSSSSPIGGMIVGIKTDETGVVMVREWEDLIFGTRDVERMRIKGTDTTGNILVASTTDYEGYKFQITEDADAATLMLRRANGAAGLTFFRDDGSISNNNNMGQIAWAGDAGGFYVTATIRAQAGQTWSAGNQSGRLVFATTPDSTTTLTDQMTLYETGNLRLINGNLQLTSDTILYRDAANVFKTDDAFHVAGDLKAIGEFYFTGNGSIALGAGRNDNVSTTNDKVVHKVTPGGSGRTIAGLTGGFDGRIIVLTNLGSQSFTIEHEEASSTAANRLHLLNNLDMIIDNDGAVILWYDGSSARWRQINAWT